jgi:hypothetical protein
MAQAAATHDLLPRSISFKGALQTLEAFQPLLELRADRGGAHRLGLYRTRPVNHVPARGEGA